MEYNTYQPCSELDGLVKCYWTLEIPREVPKGRQQILSDGCMDMIFNLGDDVKRILPEDQYLIQPRSFVLGQIIRPMWIEPMGKVETFAVRFYPGSFSYFTKSDMSDLADRDTDLKELFDPGKVFLLESAIKQTKDTGERISLIEKFLFDVLKENADIPHLVKSVIDKILQKNGHLSVKEAILDNPGKRRNLERKFAEKVGTSPKQLCKAIRLQKALKSMLNEDKKLTDIGYESDYFDQAHFIKDFKNFTGISPKQFYTNKDFALSSLLYAKN